MIDTTSIYTHIMAQMPGQNLTPQAPGDFGAKVDRGLNFDLNERPLN